jgi:hypothetical protein
MSSGKTAAFNKIWRNPYSGLRISTRSQGRKVCKVLSRSLTTAQRKARDRKIGLDGSKIGVINDIDT